MKAKAKTEEEELADEILSILAKEGIRRIENPQTGPGDGRNRIDVLKEIKEMLSKPSLIEHMRTETLFSLFFMLEFLYRIVPEERKKKARKGSKRLKARPGEKN